MPGTLKVGGNIIASHTGVEGAGTVTLGNVVLGDSAVPTNNYTFRNRIINGDMRIDQRNAGSEVTFNSTFIFPIDRFRSGGIGPWSGSADIRAIQSTDAPAGFKNSLKIYTNSTAASSSTDSYCLTHPIEGYQITDFNFGTSDVKSLTISFYVKGTAGTYGFGFTVGSGMYITTYTVTSSWNRIVINVPGSSTYSPQSTTNSYGFNLLWDLGAGSNFETTTLNQWTTNTTKSRTSSCIQFGATTGAELFITGVQLEEGTVATPFEHRPIGVELSLCQRYYEWGVASGSGYGKITAIFDAGSTSNIDFKVTKRVVPTMTNMTLSGNQYPNNQSNSVPRYEGGYSRSFRYTTEHNTTFWNVVTGNGGTEGVVGHQIIWNAYAEL